MPPVAFHAPDVTLSVRALTGPARTEALMNPYTTPILRRLGTLADLTKNGGGSWKQPKDQTKSKNW